MKKVALYFYSQGNLGDDLFVNIVNQRYKNKLEFISRITPKFSYMQDIKAHRKGFMWLLIKVLVRLTKQNLDLLWLLRKNDLLLYIGGSIFIENNGPNHMTKWRREERFYQSLKKPYYILGANFGPYIHDEFLDVARKIIAGARDVCFRDTKSRDVFADLSNVRYASDIVFSIQTDGYAPQEGKKVIFSIIDATHHFRDGRVGKYEAEITKLTLRYMGMGYEVVYMSFCKFEGDEDVIERIVTGLGEKGKMVKKHYYRGDIRAALNEISNSSTVVSTRFHATILGLVFNKQVIPFIYSAKTSNVLDDMGFTGQVYDMRNADSDTDDIDIRAVIKHDVADQRNLANEQFKELDKVLTRRN